MKDTWRRCALSVLAAMVAAACSSEETSSSAAHGSDPSGSGAGGAGAAGGAGGSAGSGGMGGAAPGASCEPGSRPGDPAGAVGEKTAGGTDFNVRTPPTYDPTKGAPLIVVYAPAGGDAKLTESFTKLTPDASARGYVIAYVNHVVPDTQAKVEDAASVPVLIAAKWCIDPKRTYLTGHSDGGSVATLIAVLSAYDAAAIAPSAAGANGGFLNQQPCPAPLPVMVLHSSGDMLFPGFGAEAAAYWAKCDACSATPGAPLPDGCVPHTGCTADVEVQYCEGQGPHGMWPGLNASMLDFFDRFALAE